MDFNLKKNEFVKFNEEPDAFPPECTRFVRNFNLLGSPIEDTDYCTNYITTYVKKRVKHAHSALMGVRDPQALVKCSIFLCAAVRPYARSYIFYAPYHLAFVRRLSTPLMCKCGKLSVME